MSLLRRKLESGAFVLTAEVTPPVSADPTALLAKAMPLRGLADAVNVTDGAGARAHLDAVVAAMLLLREGIEPVLQLTCRDRNRIALQGALLGAAAAGVKNLLLLTGDDPTAGDQPEAKPVFDLDSNALVRTAAGLRDRGALPGGRTAGGKLDFLIGVADAPIDPPEGWKPDGLARKIEAGAVFAQTQFCMDLELLSRYLRRLSEAGLAGRIRLIVGIAPLASARSARWIRDHLFGAIVPEAVIDRLARAAEPRREGQRICLELMRGLAAMPGVAGAHLMAPLNEAAIAEVIAAYRAAPPGTAGG